MPTIAFVSSKGGVGKTTSALVLALGLAARGRTVALVDGDPNLPLSAWRARAAPPAGIEVIEAPRFDALPGALREARRRADWAVVDTEGGAPRIGGAAIANADIVLHPLAASPLEIREAVRARALVERLAGREGRPIPFAALFARTPAGYRRAFSATREELAAAGVTTLATVLTDREAFRLLFATGGGLDRVRPPKAAAAASELAQGLAAEILQIFED